MKALVTEQGFLCLERKGKMKPTSCPYVQLHGPKGELAFQMCGDWCALFSTWKEQDAVDTHRAVIKPGLTHILLCHKNLIVDELEDKRPEYIDPAQAFAGPHR